MSITAHARARRKEKKNRDKNTAGRRRHRSSAQSCTHTTLLVCFSRRPRVYYCFARGKTNTIFGLSATAPDGDWVGTVECVNGRPDRTFIYETARCLSARKIVLFVFRAGRGDAPRVRVRGRFNRSEVREPFDADPREIGFRPERCRRDHRTASPCGAPLSSEIRYLGTCRRYLYSTSVYRAVLDRKNKLTNGTVAIKNVGILEHDYLYRL